MFESPHFFSEIRILCDTKVIHSSIMSFLVPELNYTKCCVYLGGRKKEERRRGRKKEEGRRG